MAQARPRGAGRTPTRNARRPAHTFLEARRSNRQPLSQPFFDDTEDTGLIGPPRD
jgi:hypothetical protein